jgi:hypothetical protein
MTTLLNRKIHSLQPQNRDLHSAHEQELWVYLSDPAAGIFQYWIEAAHKTFQNLSIEEHFDSMSYADDYINYLRNHQITLSLEAVRQIEDVQRMFTHAKSDPLAEVKLPENLKRGLQNWYLLHLAFNKNPQSVSKNFTTDHVSEIVYRVGSKSKNLRQYDYIIEHISDLFFLPDHYLSAKSTALGKYLKLIFQKLVLHEERQLVLDTISFARQLRLKKEAGTKDFLLLYPDQIYLLILILKDLKIIN